MRDTEGAALVFVVLLTMALFALAHGLLLAAGAEYAAARAGVRLAGRHSLAEGGMRKALAHGHGAWMDSVPSGGVRTAIDSTTDGSRLSTRWRRLTDEVWLVEAEARSVAGLTSSTRRLAWSLAPDARVRALRATVSIGDSASATILGAVQPTAGRATAAVGGADLGLLGFDTLIARGLPVTGPGRPAPVVVSGRCVASDPWNWGDPDRPLSACGAHIGYASARGNLLVSGGAGQILLVVDGDVDLAQGARMFGLIVTRGRLRLTGGAVFEGLAIALGGLEVDGTALVRSSPNWAARVLDSHRTVIGASTALHSARRLDPGSP